MNYNNLLITQKDKMFIEIIKENCGRSILKSLVYVSTSDREFIVLK